MLKLSKDTSSWQTHGSGRLTPSFTGNQTANHQLPPSTVNFPKFSGHREGPQEPKQYSHSEITEDNAYKIARILPWIIEECKQEENTVSK